MVTTRLEMIFQNVSGQKVTLAVLEPAADLTEAQVQAAMSTIIAKNIFATAGGDLTAIAGARIIARDVTELAL